MLSMIMLTLRIRENSLTTSPFLEMVLSLTERTLPLMALIQCYGADPVVCCDCHCIKFIHRSNASLLDYPSTLLQSGNGSVPSATGHQGGPCVHQNYSFTKLMLPYNSCILTSPFNFYQDNY